MRDEALAIRRNSSLAAERGQSNAPLKPVERHFTVLEVAKMESLSERSIRRIFENESGVIYRGHTLLPR